LEHSLTALLPVRNAEGTLAETLAEWLEVLPELTSRFELVVVDDCSSDATIEIADDLGGSYPQLVVVRHAHPRGRSAAITTGLRRARGEVIFLADEDCDLSLGEVRKLWTALEEHELVLGRPAAFRQRKWVLHRTPLPDGQRGFQIGYRRAFHSLASAMADQATLLDHLRRNGCQWHEVEIQDRTPRLAPHRIAAPARKLSAPPAAMSDLPQRADPPQMASSKPRRPNYLTRLRDLVFGQ
jgi:glycosyltransferase involved in cell wall biosynthesis